ncbi:MAG TPA: nucleoside deaminase [Longimicrobiales bacterium]|nr:nucleoside deaminase [Longimicrobiales bacterium]
MTSLGFTLPAWVEERIAVERVLATDQARMAFAVALARENVLRGGGPFGAVVLERASGRVVAAGVNLVVPERSSLLHAEVVAVLAAQRALGGYSLRDAALPEHELVASCDPCAMCLGATLWSGVRRLVCGAARADAEAVGFDEGPVFDASYAYLEERGIEVVRGVLREEAAAVLVEYAEGGGPVYND